MACRAGTHRDRIRQLPVFLRPPALRDIATLALKTPLTHYFILIWRIPIYPYIRNSPGKRLRRFAFGAWPDLVQPVQLFLAEFYLNCAQAFCQLIHLAWTHNGRGHYRICQQPGESYVCRNISHFFTKFLVLTDLGCIFLHFLCNTFFAAPPCLLLAA